MDESIAELSKAIALEPLSGNNNATLALIYLYAGQDKKGLELARQTFDLDPGVATSRLALGVAYNVNRLYHDAIRLSESSLQTDPANQHMLMISENAYARSGRKQEAEEVVRTVSDLARSQHMATYYVASIYAALGEKDKAFAELDTAYEQQDPGGEFYLAQDTKLNRKVVTKFLHEEIFMKSSHAIGRL